MDHLILYSRNCKKCKLLDPEEETTFKKCSYVSGNTECPASDVQIVVAGKARRYAAMVVKSREEGDLKKEVSLLRKVSQTPLAFQLKFKEWLTK